MRIYFPQATAEEDEAAERRWQAKLAAGGSPILPPFFERIRIVAADGTLKVDVPFAQGTVGITEDGDTLVLC